MKVEAFGQCRNKPFRKLHFSVVDQYLVSLFMLTTNTRISIHSQSHFSFTEDNIIKDICHPVTNSGALLIESDIWWPCREGIRPPRTVAACDTLTSIRARVITSSCDESDVVPYQLSRIFKLKKSA